MEQKIFFLLNLGDLYYTSLVVTLEEKHLRWTFPSHHRNNFMRATFSYAFMSFWGTKWLPWKGLYITKKYFLVEYCIVSTHAKFESHSCFLRAFMEEGGIHPPPHPVYIQKKPILCRVNSHSEPVTYKQV